MEEESFPRGGSTSHSQTKSTKKRKDVSKEEKDLFETKGEEPTAKRKKPGWVEKTKQKKAKRKAAAASQVLQPRAAGRVEFLTLKIMATDMLLLGCVKEIREYELLLSLPNGQTGSVQLTNVSDAYTDLLQRLASGDATADEELHSLADLFRMGQVVRCRVVDIEEQETGGKKHVKLSVNPRDANRSFTANSLKNGLVLPGCVSSREDHGYVIDLGIKGVNAFIKNKAAKGYIDEWNQGNPLKTGQYLDCMVELPETPGPVVVENRVVSLSIQPGTVYRAQVTESMGVTLHTLQPGMTVHGKIMKKTDDGLIVRFLKLEGSIHRSHLEQSPRNYEVHSEIQACVLYVHQASRVVTLTQLPHLVTPDLAPSKLFGDLDVGNVLEKVKVRFADQKKGVYFNLGDRVTGFARMSNMSDEQKKDLSSTYAKGTEHRCRVLRLDYVDRVVQISLKKNVIEQQFLKYADIEPGAVVECEVRGFHAKGVSVKVTQQIHGLVPTLHLADIPLKHPEKHHQLGGNLKCRVLKVDPEERRLILSNKRSLVSSKLPVITEFSDCKPGDITEGFIAQIKATGVLVVFYNDVKGWVPKGELSTETIEFPEKVFYLGQVVKCRVLTSVPEQEKLVLSFKLSGKVSFGSKPVEVPEDFEVGKLVDCRVVEVTDKGLDVRLLPSKMAAFLPKMHLSDHPGNCELMLNAHKKGDVIRGAMYAGCSQVISLTKKASLITASNEGSLLSDFSLLKPGIVLPGVVKKFMEYGVFLDMLNGLVGLVPNKYVSDCRLGNPSTLYKEGQTLLAKVIEVNEDKKRFLLSLRESDCYHGDTAVGLDILQDYLQEYQRFLDGLKTQKGKKAKLATVQVGHVIKATVTEVTEHGILCQLEKKVKGFATNDNMSGVRCEAGQEVEAVVLYVDPHALCVELSLDHDLVKAVKNFKDNKYSQAREGQMVKSETHLIKPEFVLVSLKGHASGRFAYLPAKRHLNDIIGGNNFCVGQINHVKIKRVVGEQVLASLQIQETEMEKIHGRPKEEEGQTAVKHGLRLGMVVTATVQRVHEHQMNVLVKNVHGRVHITEVADAITEGTNPLSAYKEGEDVKVKIIGFREVHSRSYLPISSGRINKALPECTLKPSKLATKGLQRGEEVQGREYNVGDKVNAFVTGYHHRCIWTDISPIVHGKVYFLNASDNLDVLEDAAAHFKEGRAYEATVIGRDKGGTLELSFTGVPPTVEEGSVVKGYVLYVDSGHGLSLQLGQGHRGHVALTDVADAYEDDVTEKYCVNQVVKCRVLKYDEENKEKCVLSLRASRCSKKKKKKIVDKEYGDLESLGEGQILRGYVASCNSQGVFVSISREVTARVQFSHASKYYLSDPEVVFYPGKLVTAKILSVDLQERRVQVSLLEEHTGQPENIPKEYTAGLRDTKKTKPPKKKKVPTATLR